MNSQTLTEQLPTNSDTNALKTPLTAKDEFHIICKKMWAEIVSNATTVTGLLILGLLLPLLFSWMKELGYISVPSLLGDARFTSLIESMFHNEAPLLLGCITIFLLMIIANVRNDDYILAAIRILNTILAACVVALISTLALTLAILCHWTETSVEWLDMLSMFLNYTGALFYSLLGLFVCHGLRNNPNKGALLQRVCFGIGLICAVYTFFVKKGDGAAMVILALVNAVAVLVTIVELHVNKPKSIRTEPLTDILTGACGMVFAATVLTASVYLASNTEFTTKKQICLFEFEVFERSCSA
ncbi:hypothetical protein [Vibrio parahaemolyticus]|uniref:hypothetical protein n=1 Tax=Vibrio parahaemolyticus TaxID=670 RepID=UPI00111FB5F9|nr:hypothetical protein [Vibrio parahaemolyticus]TOO93552.1 hypothetical protein CGH25_15795 [Vibrio parahaemolyticus]TOO97606.1 hypothetical protein CGH24_22820 [Vibrio parahaemolyticus]TOQ68390.1 hypothetical protein CGG89_20520 [Vibrio parahaemolyticus]